MWLCGILPVDQWMTWRFVKCVRLSFFLLPVTLCILGVHYIWIAVKFYSISTVFLYVAPNQHFVHLTSPHPPLFPSFLFTCSLSISAATGMHGKSILFALGRHTPEHSSVMSAAGSGATTSPCSSRSSSQHSGTPAHTPGGPHRSPCSQVKTSEGSSNALTPNSGPARSPVSTKLSPGEVSFTQAR